MSKAYVVLIADAVDSRSLSPAARATLQSDLHDYLRDLNRTYRRDLVARFAITLGDELQCLLRDGRAVWAIGHQIRHAFPEVDWIAACGLGPITTKLSVDAPPPADEVDGPCFHEARAALEVAKRERRILAFGGFTNPLLDAFGAYYSALYWSWTATQRKQANEWRLWAKSKARLPAKLLTQRREPSALSHLRRRMAWPLVAAGDKMFRSLLEAS